MRLLIALFFILLITSCGFFRDEPMLNISNSTELSQTPTPSPTPLDWDALANPQILPENPDNHEPDILYDDLDEALSAAGYLG